MIRSIIQGNVILPPAKYHAAPLPDVRCPKCNRLLFRGVLVGEIQCGKCGHLVRLS